MADRKNHLAVAAKNEELIQHLILTKARHSEWVAVIAFYKALHLIDAMLFCDHSCKHGGDHKERQRVLKTTRKYNNIYEHYRPLFAASCIARYLEHGSVDYSAFSTYLNPEQVVSKLVNHHLKQLETSVMRILATYDKPSK